MSNYPAKAKPSNVEHCALATAGEHLEKPVRPGTDLCASCHASFGPLLLELAGLTVELPEATVKVGVQRFDRDQVTTSGHGDVAATWNPQAAQALSDIEFFAEKLTQLLYQDHPEGCSIPARVPTGDLHSLKLATTTKQALLTIRTRARWLSEYPGVGDALVRQARRLRAAGRKALDPNAPRVQRRRTKFLCTDVVATVDGEELLCDAPMWRIIPADGTDQLEEIVCEHTLNGQAEHHRYAPDEWLNLNAS